MSYYSPSSDMLGKAVLHFVCIHIEQNNASHLIFFYTDNNEILLLQLKSVATTQLREDHIKRNTVNKPLTEQYIELVLKIKINIRMKCAKLSLFISD